MNDLDSLIERELQIMRRQPRKQLQPAPEVREGNVIERMVKAALPSVVRDFKVRRAAANTIRKAQEKQEAAHSIFFPQQATKEFDGDVPYEQSVPDFI